MTLPDPALQKTAPDASVTFDAAYDTVSGDVCRTAVKCMYDTARAAEKSIIEAESSFSLTHELKTVAYSTGFHEQTERNDFDQECSVTMCARTAPGHQEYGIHRHG
jgi:hypothetical protein